MSAPDLADRDPTEVSRLLPPGAVVLALTDDGTAGRFEPVREAASRLARAARGSVVLFHAPPGAPSADQGRPRCFDPLAPGDGDGTDGPRRHTGTRRRDLLRDEAARVASTGVPVRVWLSRLAGPAGIAEAVRATGSAVVLVATEPVACGLVARAIRRTLSYYAARLDVPVIAVDPRGEVALVPPLGSGAPSTDRRPLALLTASSLPAARPAGGLAR